MKFLLFAIIAYVAGSINFAEIVTFRKIGEDIRNFGDGNPGATNVFLHVDKRLGFLVGISDGLKGFLPLLLASQYLPESTLPLIALCGILGHQYPIFHGFKNGGTGIAITSGDMVFFAPHLTALIIILSSLTAILPANYLGSFFSRFERGEAMGFILLIAFSLFSKNTLLKTFVLLDITLIVIRKRHIVMKLLFKKA